MMRPISSKAVGEARAHATVRLKILTKIGKALTGLWGLKLKPVYLSRKKAGEYYSLPKIMSTEIPFEGDGQQQATAFNGYEIENLMEPRAYLHGPSFTIRAAT
jgi:hypothetical protein